MGIKTLGNPPVTNGILYVNNYAALPVVGDIKLLYVTKDNNKAFRYSGTAYVGVFINKSDTAVNWTASNPILAQGELGIELVTNKFKIGNGVLAWTLLPYATGELPIINDPTFATATNSNVPSAESVKAYVDAHDGTGSSQTMDGGSSASVYQIAQNVDGGIADSIYSV